MLAQGSTYVEVEKETGINQSSLAYLMKDADFSKEVDTLSMMYGMASKAERVRMITKMAKQFIKEDGNYDISGFTLLDLLKEARMQTEGINLNVLSQLTAINEDAAPSANERPGGYISLPEPEAEETE
jgi:hypothetical protein